MPVRPPRTTAAAPSKNWPRSWRTSSAGFQRSVEFLHRLGLRPVVHRRRFGTRALRASRRPEEGTTAFDASGDLAGLECKGGQRWSENLSPDDVGVDAVASLPEMVAVGGTKLSTDDDGRWLSEQAWYNIPLTLGTAGGASTLFARPEWQTVGIGSELPDRRLVPDVSAVSDPSTGVRIVFNQKVVVGGGTSQAAPIWAGLAALMDQKLLASGAGSLGELNPLLYQLAKNPTAPPGLRDINFGATQSVFPAPSAMTW